MVNSPFSPPTTCSSVTDHLAALPIQTGLALYGHLYALAYGEIEPNKRVALELIMHDVWSTMRRLDPLRANEVMNVAFVCFRARSPAEYVKYSGMGELFKAREVHKNTKAASTNHLPCKLYFNFASLIHALGCFCKSIDLAELHFEDLTDCRLLFAKHIIAIGDLIGHETDTKPGVYDSEFASDFDRSAVNVFSQEMGVDESLSALVLLTLCRTWETLFVERVEKLIRSLKFTGARDCLLATYLQMLRNAMAGNEQWALNHRRYHYPANRMQLRPGGVEVRVAEFSPERAAPETRSRQLHAQRSYESMLPRAQPRTTQSSLRRRQSYQSGTAPRTGSIVGERPFDSRGFYLTELHTVHEATDQPKARTVRNLHHLSINPNVANSIRGEGLRFGEQSEFLGQPRSGSPSVSPQYTSNISEYGSIKGDDSPSGPDLHPHDENHYDSHRSLDGSVSASPGPAIINHGELQTRTDRERVVSPTPSSCVFPGSSVEDIAGEDKERCASDSGEEDPHVRVIAATQHTNDEVARHLGYPDKSEFNRAREQDIRASAEHVSGENVSQEDCYDFLDHYEESDPEELATTPGLMEARMLAEHDWPPESPPVSARKMQDKKSKSNTISQNSHVQNITTKPIHRANHDSGKYESWPSSTTSSQILRAHFNESSTEKEEKQVDRTGNRRPLHHTGTSSTDKHRNKAAVPRTPPRCNTSATEPRLPLHQQTPAQRTASLRGSLWQVKALVPTLHPRYQGELLLDVVPGELVEIQFSGSRGTSRLCCTLVCVHANVYL